MLSIKLENHTMPHRLYIKMEDYEFAALLLAAYFILSYNTTTTMANAPVSLGRLFNTII